MAYEQLRSTVVQAYREGRTMDFIPAAAKLDVLGEPAPHPELSIEGWRDLISPTELSARIIAWCDQAKHDLVILSGPELGAKLVELQDWFSFVYTYESWLDAAAVDAVTDAVLVSHGVTDDLALMYLSMANQTYPLPLTSMIMEETPAGLRPWPMEPVVV